MASVTTPLRAETNGLILLGLALIVNAVLLWGEIRVERVPVNDLSFHIAASQRLTQSLVTGDSILDPWVSLWSLGYPLWHTYQPLPHMVAGLWLAITSRFASAPAAFAVLYYLMMVIVPASTYLGARLFGLDPLAAGFASILIIGVSEIGDFSRYGLSYGAYIRRGSGLYTQLMSYNLLMPALGLAARALQTGKRRILAACLVAATALSHVVFGYVAILTIVILALVGPRGDRSRRVVRAASILIPTVILLAWFVVPMLLTSGEVNRCRWDDVWKFDSWGARNALNALLTGGFFDDGRMPVMTLALLGASLTALYQWNRAMPRRLLILSAVWLAIFFGRTTWGYFMLALGLPGQFHVSRFESAFELFAVLLTAWALARLVRAASRNSRIGQVAVGVGLGAIGLVIFIERAHFVWMSTRWGDESLAAYARERGDLDASLADIDAMLRELPGRVSVGPSGMWGAKFRIAESQPYSFLTLAGMDEVSFLYHSLSYGSDVMAELEERDPFQALLFAVRAVLAPVGQKVPAYYRLHSVHGGLAVYEVSNQGYFGLVDIGVRYDGSLSSVLNHDWGWMQNPSVRAGAMVALGGDIKGVPEWKPYQQIPPLNPRYATMRGKIISEIKQGETYSARLAVLRPCYALLKITYYPGLQATVDGKPVPIFRVYPDFCAIPVAPGEHQVEVRYRPGPLKAILLLAGFVFVGLIAQAMRRPDYAAMEKRTAARLAELATPWATDRARTALALAFLFLLAMRPLFHGDLVDGHDALAYPPRVVEMSRALADQSPPIWAPDLGSGHGQPLFEFSPPLLYLVAMPFYKIGFKLADSLQFGLALLFAIGTLAMYKIARRYGGSRVAAVGVTGAWLFSPYIMLDLYVRVAMAEAAALAILPLALYGMLWALDSPSILSACMAALTIAIVLLAHNSVALLFIPVLAALTLSRAVVSRASAANAIAGGMALLGGLALSAYFWLPAMVEKDFVKTKLLTTDFFNWANHIISPFQLFWGRWGFGYSVPGPNDGISFSLGIPHLILGVSGFVLLFRQARGENRSRRQDLADMTVFALAAIGGAFLAIEWSSPIWARVHTLQYLQQPWRTLFLPALFLPLFALYAFERMGTHLASLAIVALVLFNLAHTEPKGFSIYDDAYFSPGWIAYHGINTTTREEYEPVTVGHRPYYEDTLLRGVDSTPAVYPLEVGTASQSFSVEASQPTRMQDSLFYYPGWTVLVDRQQVRASAAPVSGEITFALPAGRHDVQIELRPTPIRRWSFYLSVASAGLIALMMTLALGSAWRRSQPVEVAKPRKSSKTRSRRRR
jgi:uncharacterized membrane protein